MLEGIALANPDTLTYIPEYNLIMRTDAPRDDKVSIVQGSGSGHEPAHVMIVGKGMLDAACPGDVFAAPPMDYVLRDRQAAGHAQGRAAADQQLHRRPDGLRHGQGDGRGRGRQGRDPTINDDVAVKDSTYTVGRRGVAGNFFVIKAVGAASEQGADLDEVIRIGEQGQRRHPHHGHRADRVHPAGQGSPLFELGDDEIEIGVGIHGEPGRERRRSSADADEIVDELLEAVVADLPYSSGDEVALMINGLGGTPISELYILYRRAHQQLAERGINVGRSYVGEYCTSLDMAGASLTLVRLDDEIESCWPRRPRSRSGSSDPSVRPGSLAPGGEVYMARDTDLDQADAIVAACRVEADALVRAAHEHRRGRRRGATSTRLPPWTAPSSSASTSPRRRR